MGHRLPAYLVGSQPASPWRSTYCLSDLNSTQFNSAQLNSTQLNCNSPSADVEQKDTGLESAKRSNRLTEREREREIGGWFGQEKQTVHVPD